MEIRKVFTKYDVPFEIVKVPILKEIEAYILPLYANITILENRKQYEILELKPIHIHNLLEDVKIITYSDNNDF